MIEGKESYAADAFAVSEIVLRPLFPGEMAKRTDSKSALQSSNTEYVRGGA